MRRRPPKRLRPPELRRAAVTRWLAVPLRGALWNPEVQVELQQLTDVVAEARALPMLVSQPKPDGRARPGSIGGLVSDVLEAAAKPMTIREVVEAIERQTGEPASYESVRYQLTRSRTMRRGTILRLENGTYAATESSASSNSR